MKGSIRQRKPSSKWEYTFNAGKKADGSRNRVSKGGFNTKRECQDALTQAIADFQNSGIVIKETNYSVAQYMYFYLEDYIKVKCRYNTHRLYKDAIDRYIIPNIGHYYLKDISSEALQKLFDDVYEQTQSKSIIKNMQCVLSKSFRFALKKYKFIKHDNMQYVHIDYEFKTNVRNIATKEDAYVILNYFKERYTHSYYILLVLAYHTGMRRSELLALDFINTVDLDNRIIHVEKQARFIKGKLHLVDLKTKASKRDIIMSSELTTILKEHKEYLIDMDVKHKNVLVNEDLDIMNSECVGHVLRIIKNRIGLDVRLHDFRHLHGSLLCEVGCNYKAIQDRLGHSNLSTTMNIYVNPTDELKKNTAKMWEDVL